MKRKTLDVQRRVLEEIRTHPGITMSRLERRVRTNPASLREHCVQLEYLGLVRIIKEERTTIVQVAPKRT